MTFFIRMEHIPDERQSEPIGPFKSFMQLTYSELRSGPDGNSVAQMDSTGTWYLREPYGDPNTEWTDVVIWWTED